MRRPPRCAVASYHRGHISQRASYHGHIKSGHRHIRAGYTPLVWGATAVYTSETAQVHSVELRTTRFSEIPPARRTVGVACKKKRSRDCTRAPRRCGAGSGRGIAPNRWEHRYSCARKKNFRTLSGLTPHLYLLRCSLYSDFRPLPASSLKLSAFQSLLQHSHLLPRFDLAALSLSPHRARSE